MHNAGFRYTLVARLGEGSFGEVWEAKHQVTGKVVALKLEKQSFLGTIKYEASVLGALRGCEGVVRILGFGKVGESGVSYLAVDLLGDTLRVRRTRLSGVDCQEKALCAVGRIGLDALRVIRGIHGVVPEMQVSHFKQSSTQNHCVKNVSLFLQARFGPFSSRTRDL